MQYKQRNMKTSFFLSGLKDKPTFKITDDLQKELSNRRPYY